MRRVTFRRVTTLTSLAALAAAGTVTTAAGQGGSAGVADDGTLVIAQLQAEGEGQAIEGEGEGGEGTAASLEGDVAFLHDIGFMEGHIRAGLALYRAGDRAAAVTHMGHPIKEKYDAVAERLERLGEGHQRDLIVALAEAAEAGAEPSEIEAQAEAVFGEFAEVRERFPAADRLAALVALTRTAAEEYAEALGEGRVSDLHEYQDAWGFLQAVAAEARALGESGSQAVHEAAEEILEQLGATEAAFGNLQGEGAFEADPSILYGAAARMELAALALADDASAEGVRAEGEGEGD
ncbi:MAG: hypothetical protein D6686_00590 [Alphaproteobacteria bacterium]|nr:MAG: hypothetical protein D6686_00590 [Alphaproteobacteria bacterium]